MESTQAQSEVYSSDKNKLLKILGSGSYEMFLAMAAFSNLTGESFVNLTLFILRRKEPDLPRAYRAKGYPFLPAIMVLGAVIFLSGYVISNTMNSLCCIGILIYSAYLLVKAISKRKTNLNLGA